MTQQLVADVLHCVVLDVPLDHLGPLRDQRRQRLHLLDGDGGHVLPVLRDELEGEERLVSKKLMIVAIYMMKMKSNLLTTAFAF